MMDGPIHSINKVAEEEENKGEERWMDMDDHPWWPAGVHERKETNLTVLSVQRPEPAHHTNQPGSTVLVRHSTGHQAAS